ncbi:putative bifunctional diguanylate cyclase/phosphodiesterase [Catellatospora paridis]|uniref:putative bifunctional diguanylate cyclase/phosphodiesterase n=1 Tax=Catellatospora paridis TaxID=1617086 RepID=UPI0012D4C022|nr:EAL domain-containing protein [Catellatospora paridis]
MSVHRSIVKALQRLTGTAATPTAPAHPGPARTSTQEHTGEPPGRPAAVEITSGSELSELAASLNAVTQQVQARAREQRRVRDMITAERDLVDSVLEIAGSHILVVILDQDGRVVQFNRACESTTGYSRAEVEGRRISELFLLPAEKGRAAPAFGEPMVSAPESAPPGNFVCTWLDRAGRHHHIAWSNATVIDRPTGNTYVIATGQDITDRLIAEAELHEARERFRLAFDNAPIGMCLVSREGRFLQVNRALEETLGRPEAQLLNLGVTDVAHPGDAQAILQTITDMRAGQSHAGHDEVRLLGPDDRVVWARMSASAVHRDNGELLYYLTQVHDITARRTAEERLARQALHDPLTGLPNRASLLARLERELGREHPPGSLTGLLYADLDGFTMVNDSLGQTAGDEVLREVARRLRASVGPSDTVARVGSDEFVILCREVPDQSHLLDLARRVADAVSAPIIVGGQRESVISISTGIAFGPSDDLDADRLVRNANIALCQAKAGGRSGCRLYDESLGQYVIDRARIEQALRQGLRDGHFVLQFEPIVDVTTHQVVAVEALVRLNHPQLGLLMPGAFIEIAEDSGLIAPIGAWVLQEACRLLADWRGADLGCGRLGITVNVSARQVARPDLADTVAQALAQSGIPPQCLSLELTESALMEADVGALRMLERIRDMGVRLGIDDFGTGYSSLLYLKRLPVSFIKIDRSFVSGLVPDPTDREIVTAVVRLGRALGLVTIAEGVESPEQLDILKDLDCELAQGYLFGPSTSGAPNVAQPWKILLDQGRRAPGADSAVPPGPGAGLGGKAAR